VLVDLSHEINPVHHMRMTHPQLNWKGDWWRVPRVAWWLLRRPQDFTPYLKFGFSRQQTPLDLGMPWWSFGATRAVEKFLQPEMTVFEFGSGGSSIFLASRVAQVTCVEDEEKWADLVRVEAARRGLGNLDVLFRPFDFHNAKDFGSSPYLASLGVELYDLIVVDGKEESEQVRDLCFWKAEECIRPGGLIVVDDSWRYPQVKARNKARRVRDYKGTGYCRMGVTSTCLFYY
jgi:hypothetical protein